MPFPSLPRGSATDPTSVQALNTLGQQSWGQPVQQESEASRRMKQQARADCKQKVADWGSQQFLRNVEKARSGTQPTANVFEQKPTPRNMTGKTKGVNNQAQNTTTRASLPVRPLNHMALERKFTVKHAWNAGKYNWHLDT